jgi:hypothetical protein
MEKYKIKRNPKPLSDEQINRHKDFGKLLSDQQKLHRYKDGTKPLYKNPGFMAMMVILGVVLLMLVVDRPEKEGQEIPQDTVAVVKADTGLQIPLDQNTPTLSDLVTKKIVPQTTTSEKQKTAVVKSIGYETFKVDPKMGAVLYTNSGLRIIVPSMAFSEQIKKEVTLQYRETEITLLKEDGLKSPPVTPEKTFMLYGVESATGRAVTLSKPVVIEYVTSFNKTSGLLYSYMEEKNEWLSTGKENRVYRFTIQANDSQFPELALFKNLAWELPSEAGKPTDFNYIFNRSWKSFSYKTTDKKELAVKSTNSSGTFKGVPDIATIVGDSKRDQKLREAFYSVYNFSVGRSTDEEHQKQSLKTIDSWKNSEEGMQYNDWLKTETGLQQFYSTNKTSRIPVNTFGIHCLSYTLEKSAPLNPFKRILTLEKYPTKTQQYIDDTGQN